jgi:hypothetical protein
MGGTDMSDLGGELIEGRGFEMPSFIIRNDQTPFVGSVEKFLGMELSRIELEAESERAVQVHFSFFLDKSSPQYENVMQVLRQAYQAYKELNYE